jgi:hypothetical protein
MAIEKKNLQGETFSLSAMLDNRKLDGVKKNVVAACNF